MINRIPVKGPRSSLSLMLVEPGCNRSVPGSLMPIGSNRSFPCVAPSCAPDSANRPCIKSLTAATKSFGLPRGKAHVSTPLWELTDYASFYRLAQEALNKRKGLQTRFTPPISA